MRCSGWSSLAISACSALLLAAPASAHVTATPTFVRSDDSSSITFSGPNERTAPMTGFSITVPPGLRIEHAHDADGWTESLEGPTARWTGGAVAPEAELVFGATIAADAAPGFVEVIATQRYADGNDVRWSVPVTIAPPEKSPSQNLALAGVVGLIGVLVVVAIAMLAWRRRSTR